VEKLLTSFVSEYFAVPLPNQNPQTIAEWYGNKQWSQHQMLFISCHFLEKAVKRMDLLIPNISDAAVEELRETIRKIALMLRYAVENDSRWKDQNIDFSELCAYIDIELLKEYPDENHIPETIPA
jgi:hypothetical protein